MNRLSHTGSHRIVQDRTGSYKITSSGSSVKVSRMSFIQNPAMKHCNFISLINEETVVKGLNPASGCYGINAIIKLDVQMDKEPVEQELNPWGAKRGLEDPWDPREEGTVKHNCERFSQEICVGVTTNVKVI